MRVVLGWGRRDLNPAELLDTHHAQVLDRWGGAPQPCTGLVRAGQAPAASQPAASAATRAESGDRDDADHAQHHEACGDQARVFGALAVLWARGGSLDAARCRLASHLRLDRGGLHRAGVGQRGGRPVADVGTRDQEQGDEQPGRRQRLRPDRVHRGWSGSVGS